MALVSAMRAHPPEHEHVHVSGDPVPRPPVRAGITMSVTEMPARRRLCGQATPLTPAGFESDGGEPGLQDVLHGLHRNGNGRTTPSADWWLADTLSVRRVPTWNARRWRAAGKSDPIPDDNRSSVNAPCGPWRSTEFELRQSRGTWLRWQSAHDIEVSVLLLSMSTHDSHPCSAPRWISIRPCGRSRWACPRDDEHHRVRRGGCGGLPRGATL